MKSFGDRISEAMLESGAITPAQLEEALKYQKRHGGQLMKVLLDKALVNEEDLVVGMGKALEIAPIDLSRIQIPKEIGRMIPREMARNHKMIPVIKLDDLLYVAMMDPLNMQAVDDARQATRMEIIPLVTTERMILNAIANLDAQVSQKISEIIPDSKEPVETINPENPVEFDVSANEADSDPVVKIANLILTTVLKDKASDFHLECYEKQVMLRYRIDGVLYDYPPPPKSMHIPLVSRFKIMSHLDISEHRLPQDGRIRIKIGAQNIDFRVSFLPSKYGEKVVGRILSKPNIIGSLESLGLDPDSLTAFRRAIEEPQGMIIVTGPTGSGKTRTLYTALAVVNKREYNIITVEDPIEYELGGITQVQVHPDIGYTFGRVLRTVLRQDPDIIMIGEMRDKETAHIGIEAALTGHQVFSTLHANDAPSSIARLIDMEIEPFLIASSLELVCAQRLLRKICNFCKEPHHLTDELQEKLNLDATKEKNITFFRGAGCDRCKHTGYINRFAIMEVLPITNPIRRLIVARADGSDIKQKAIQMGIRTLRMNAMLRAREGMTSLEEVLANTPSDEKA